MKWTKTIPKKILCSNNINSDAWKMFFFCNMNKIHKYAFGVRNAE